MSETNHNVKEIPAHPSMQHYLQQPTRKQPKCPRTDEWINKMWSVCVYIYTYTMEYFSTIKKDILPFTTTCIDLEGTVLIEVGHTQKDKTHDLTYMWNLN